MGREKIKPDISPDIIGINPFLSSLEIRVFKQKTDDKYVESKEGTESVWSRADVEFESEAYCKVFTDKQRRMQMLELSPREKDLYLWLIYELEKNKDYVWINKDRYMKESGVASLNTYKGALNSLIKNRFLLSTVVRDVYWINPQLFFHGNRVKMFPDNVKKR